MISVVSAYPCPFCGGNVVKALLEDNLGGRVKLLNLDKRAKDLLLVTKLYTVFEAFEDEATAVRSFS